MSSHNKSTQGSSTRSPLQAPSTSTTTRGTPTSTATQGTPTSITTRGSQTSTALATQGARTSSVTRGASTSAAASVPMPITNSGAPGASNPAHGASGYNQGSQAVFPRQGYSAANTNRREDVFNPTTGLVPSSPTSSPSTISSTATPLASDFPLPRPRVWSDVAGDIRRRPKKKGKLVKSDTGSDKDPIRRTVRGL